jgi:hypothetical protein
MQESAWRAKYYQLVWMQIDPSYYPEEGFEVKTECESPERGNTQVVNSFSQAA